MAKATIKTKEGTHITIEGEKEELVKIIKLLEQPSTQTTRVKSKLRRAQKSTTARLSMHDLIEELKTEKFFDKPRSLVEIKNAFAEKGHIYNLNSISTPVVRLVRKRVIGRIKKDKKWLYVRR